MGKYSGHVTKGQRWAALRAFVLSRDRHRCTECGATGRLEVHHKRPVRTHPALSFDPENLTALCARCHTRATNTELGRTEVSPLGTSGAQPSAPSKGTARDRAERKSHAR